jgi:hypothetical protein
MADKPAKEHNSYTTPWDTIILISWLIQPD